MEQITNKVKHQLNAKGVDSIAQLRGVFDVSASAGSPFSAFLKFKLLRSLT